MNTILIPPDGITKGDDQVEYSIKGEGIHPFPHEVQLPRTLEGVDQTGVPGPRILRNFISY
jgi:hypothetical protein